MIFMKVERNFLPWIATNKTLGNEFSFRNSFIPFWSEEIGRIWEEVSILSMSKTLKCTTQTPSYTLLHFGYNLHKLSTFLSMHTKGIQNTYWSTSISYHSSKVLESRASLEVSINTIGFAYEFIFKAIEKACSNVYFL